MSGGSYNYLCFSDRIDLDELERMAARLAELAPDSAAARDTAALLAVLRNPGDTDGLREVWRCVEWFDSCDYSADQVDEAVTAYDLRVPPEPEPAPLPTCRYCGERIRLLDSGAVWWSIEPRPGRAGGTCPKGGLNHHPW